MIDSYSELESFLETIDCGKSEFTIRADAGKLNFKPTVFTGKSELSQSDYWLYQLIGNNLSRSFNSGEKKWTVRSDTLNRVKLAVLGELLTAIVECSESKMAERTSLFKEYRFINDRQENKAEYLSSIISILNYYNSAKTDKICKNNVIGLLTILRKKYGAPSRN